MPTKTQPAPDLSDATFSRKTYRIGQFLRDVGWLGAHADDLLAVYLLRRLDPALREEIMTAVSAQYECAYCTFMHAAWARAVGLDPAELRHVVRLEPSGVPPHRWAATQYARRRAAQDFAPRDRVADAVLARHFDSHKRELIEAIARAMSVANLVGNTFDALRSRLRGRPSAHSRVVDELALSALFVTAAPAALATLALIDRATPLELRRRFAAFVARFDADRSSAVGGSGTVVRVEFPARPAP